MTDDDTAKDRTASAVAGLVDLIKGAPGSVLRSIAYGDSYAVEGQSQKSLQALREVIDKLDCRLDRQPDNDWNPCEPIELVSYGGNASDYVTVVANALLMIPDLESGGTDYMESRWYKMPGRAYFEALPARFRDPLMAGFDVLWET